LILRRKKDGEEESKDIIVSEREEGYIERVRNFLFCPFLCVILLRRERDECVRVSSKSFCNFVGETTLRRESKSKRE
jgi:hypothetical protein